MKSKQSTRQRKVVSLLRRRCGCVTADGLDKKTMEILPEPGADAETDEADAEVDRLETILEDILKRSRAFIKCVQLAWSSEPIADRLDALRPSTTTALKAVKRSTRLRCRPSTRSRPIGTGKVPPRSVA